MWNIGVKRFKNYGIMYTTRTTKSAYNFEKLKNLQVKSKSMNEVVNRVRIFSC